MSTEHKSTSFGLLFSGLMKFLGYLLIFSVFFVSIVVMESIPSRRDQGSCFPLAYESATDTQPFDGSPREICFLATPNELQKIPKNRMPPNQTGIEFEVVDELSRYDTKFSYPRITVCEHNDGNCSNTFREMSRSFPKCACWQIIDGYACAGSHSAIAYRKPRGDGFSDISALLVYDGNFGDRSQASARFSANFFSDAEFTDGKKKDAKQ